MPERFTLSKDTCKSEYREVGNMKKGNWVRNKIIPCYLNGAKLALAMLLKEKPLSETQIATAISEKGRNCDRKELGKMLASLERMGVITLSDGVYSCSSEKLKTCQVSYSEDQLIDWIGMTQNTVNGKAFYSATPPMSVSSHENTGI